MPSPSSPVLGEMVPIPRTIIILSSCPPAVADFTVSRTHRSFYSLSELDKRHCGFLPQDLVVCEDQSKVTRGSKALTIPRAPGTEPGHTPRTDTHGFLPEEEALSPVLGSLHRSGSGRPA